MKNLIYLLLVLFLFACRQKQQPPLRKEMEEEKAKMKMADPTIKNLFDEVNVVKMHFFAISDAMSQEVEYPYEGKPITADAAKFLGEGLRSGQKGSTYACYRTENSGHYILRLPGEGTSGGHLVLAVWDAPSNQLVKVADLAHLTCNENTCHQQDAWLADLDDSRTLELIIRKQTAGPSGQLTDESFEVLTDDGTGHFKKAGEQLASLAVIDFYVMHGSAK
ncbi:MAG TPA: hypothetical protein ENJ20_05630 [Bacteroidetes bacterium]|nr:hypothetical protein [Bacteroidota bacterium]